MLQAEAIQVVLQDDVKLLQLALGDSLQVVSVPGVLLQLLRSLATVWRSQRRDASTLLQRRGPHYDQHHVYNNEHDQIDHCDRLEHRKTSQGQNTILYFITPSPLLDYNHLTNVVFLPENVVKFLMGITLFRSFLVSVLT